LTRRDMGGLLGRFAGDIRVGGCFDAGHPTFRAAPGWWVRTAYFGITQ
jgi:hypothetical protein